MNNMLAIDFCYILFIKMCLAPSGKFYYSILNVNI